MTAHSMTSRARVLAALRREPPDRTPFDFALGFSPYQLEVFRQRTGHTDPNEYFETDIRGVHIGPTRHLADFTAYLGELPPGAYADEWGQGHVPTQSDNPFHAHLEGYLYPLQALHEASDAASYPLPDIDAAYRYEHLPEQIAAYHARAGCGGAYALHRLRAGVVLARHGAVAHGFRRGQPLC